MPLTVPEFLKAALARPVALFGGGVSGAAARELVEALGGKAALYDERAAGAETRFGPEEARGHGLVVFSPGFPPEHPWLRLARESGLECLGEVDFGSLLWRGEVVAITGTNGKTTTTEFLAHALRCIGKQATAVGNIGHPLSRLAAETGGGAPDALAVCEISSFQAETLRHLRPTFALWTNFAEDHLERHGDMRGYFLAKARLVERTPAGAFRCSREVREFSERIGRAFPPAAGVDTAGSLADPRLAETVFAAPPQSENYRLAEAFWRARGFPAEALIEAARAFRLGRHRLQKVAEIDAVAYWNDSKATNFHAVEAALTRFERPVHLIAGGRSKGGDLRAFVGRIAPRVKALYLIGDTASALAEAAGAENVSHEPCGTLNEALCRAAAAAVPGDVVLLSPGFASFDQFRNYEDRGQQFETLVGRLTPFSPLQPPSSTRPCP